MKLIHIQTETAVYYFHQEADGRVLFSQGIQYAYRFLTSEAAHRMRESSRFFSALGQFDHANVSIITAQGGAN
jgi:hypothetical protein